MQFLRSIAVATFFFCSLSLQASFFSKFWQTPPPDENGLHYVIIGASEYGLEAAREIRRMTHRAHIIVIDSDSQITWSKAPSKKCNSKSGICSQQEADSLHITMLLGVDVERINTKTQNITLTNGEKLWFDGLLLAPYATNNLQALTHYLDHGAIQGGTIKRVVVVGGDFEALRYAGIFASRGVAVTLLVDDNQIARGNLDADASERAITYLKDHGVDVCLNCKVASYTPISRTEWFQECKLEYVEHIQDVELSTGVRINAQLLVSPCIEKQVAIAQKTGLAIDGSGIRVGMDLCAASAMYDSVRGYMIFAIGNITIPTSDVAIRLPQAVTSVVLEQARIAARNMTLRNIKKYCMFREFYRPPLLIPYVNIPLSRNDNLQLEGMGTFEAAARRDLYISEGERLEYYAVARSELGSINGLCKVSSFSFQWGDGQQWKDFRESFLECLILEAPEEPQWIVNLIGRYLRK